MKTATQASPSYRGYRFPAEIIAHCMAVLPVLSEFSRRPGLMLERGIEVSHETIRLWTLKFGAEYARRLRRREGRCGDTWYLDEVFCKTNGQQVYLWRVGDQDGAVLDILVQKRRNAKAAKRFFRKLLKGLPCAIVTDKLQSYVAPRREVMPGVEPLARRPAQQPRRKLPPVDAGTRTQNETIQVYTPRAAFFVRAYASRKPLPPLSPSTACSLLSGGYVQALWRMANDNGRCPGDQHTAAISRTKSKTEAVKLVRPQSADDTA